MVVDKGCLYISHWLSGVHTEPIEEKRQCPLSRHNTNESRLVG